MDGLSENNFVVGRNSVDVTGTCSLHTIVSDEGILPDILRLGPKELKNLSFAEYTMHSLRVLRGTASIMKQRKTDATAVAEAQLEAAMFFLAACKPKIQSRFHQLRQRFGPLKDLEEWTPVETDKILDSEIIIKDPITILLLLQIFQFSVTNHVVRVDRTTVRVLFRALLRAAGLMQDALKKNEIKAAAGLADVLRRLISKLPPAFWNIESLVNHLQTAYKPRLVTPSIPSADDEDDDKDEDEDEDDDDESIIDCDPSPVPPVCFVFYRMLEAVCAWSTAARYLLAGPISREEIPIYISIVDLPRQPIQEHSQLDLLEHWGQLAGWSKPLRNAVTKKLRPMDLRTDRGAVHCEAGLVASLLLRRHTVDVHSPEPPVLTEAFAHLTAKLPDAERAIGMAKKCCPMCRLLIETLQASPTFLRLEYGGGHSRFHPWVPPHWLPSSVLEDLEKRLLHRVSDMVSIGAHLEGSRHTSATAAVASFLKSMGGS